MKRFWRIFVSFLLLSSLLLMAMSCGGAGEGEGESIDTDPVVTSESVTETTTEAEQTTEAQTDAPEPIKYKDSLKVLAIGNSFSVDGMEYLWNICRDQGIKTVVLGNLYIGGCTLNTHWSNISGEKSAYTYYKNTAGKWKSTANVSVQTAITDEEWDVITVQQASGSSGRITTYGNLGNIVSWIEQHKTNENAEILWHATWAYAQNSAHAEFSNYQKNQMTMYQAIQTAVRTKVLTNESIDGVIPSGTALQNLRSSYVGDNVTRDGYHLEKGIGRYTAGLAWFAAITGRSVENVEWTPTAYGIVAKNLDVIKESVTNAIKTPHAVTQSEYTVAP